MRPERIHRPWEAGADELSAAGVRLGETYPRPVVDHAFARARALSAFEGLPKSGSRA
jgi:deoxyribodipyrimidine photo-lyase